MKFHIVCPAELYPPQETPFPRAEGSFSFGLGPFSSGGTRGIEQEETY